MNRNENDSINTPSWCYIETRHDYVFPKETKITVSTDIFGKVIVTASKPQLSTRSGVITGGGY